MEDINLHFTGDIHAISAAHNLLAALIDNHIHQGNELDFDVTCPVAAFGYERPTITPACNGFRRPANGVQETGFDITVASEIMAILCLAETRKI